jgi:flavodoxin
MKKRALAILMIVTLGLLTACGSNEQNSESGSTDKESESQAVSESTAQPDTASAGEEGTTEENSNQLVVYFSWSGNTKHVAEVIQQQTNADIFEIVPETPYSDDYNEVVDFAQEEQAQDARPAIANTLENLEAYDTIYLGYPNWWGDMPMILYSFLDEYDLAGKTIAPFVTSSSSGLSGTVSSIQNAEQDATVTEGLSIRENDLDDTENAVSEWLSGM